MNVMTQTAAAGPRQVDAGTVFMFSGQGSYSRPLLQRLHADYPETHPCFHHAGETSRRFLGHDFMALIDAASEQEHDAILKACPDLDQIGIYLASALTARILMQAGAKPDLLIGHSFGELAALATAGVYSIETGLQIVCQRVIALQALGDAGKMAALSCGHAHARENLAKLGAHKLEISVLNHPRQTVVSGPEADLERLAEMLAPQGISCSILKTRHPFHSSHLGRAVNVFATFLKPYDFAAPNIPVFLGVEGRMHAPGLDLVQVLSSQLMRPLDFASAVNTIHERGYRHFVECGGGDILTRNVTQNLAGKSGVVARSSDEALSGNRSKNATARPSEPCASMPIAIVSMGCVLPGAGNAEAYWQNVVEGTSGIVNLADAEPTAARDFLIGDGAGGVTIAPDKTYTLLHGSIVDVPYDAALLSGACSEAEFKNWTKGQRLLAVAAMQGVAKLASARPSASDRIQCTLGSTADGCKEYDDALFNESVQAVLSTLDEPEHLRASLAATLEEMSGYETGTSGALKQYQMYRAVFGKVLGRPVKTCLIDVACSSSLYSISLGMKALQDGEADMVLAGGVFSPGAANNALFAQFRGLTPRESRPFDAEADGVVFGDGAGIVILKRLSDALADGDRVLSVIRGVGLSSDGKSPSINVPKSEGQAIAIRRAYQHANVDIDTIQYVEAHATATPVGDAAEFNALKDAFASRDPALPAVQLASVKALIGHTGWAAGVASVIKLCKAFEAGLVPKQYHYAVPSHDIDLAHSPFTIAASSQPWPDNIGGYPRRAGINGFGFGGTNAHLVLEAFDPAYHRALEMPPARPAPQPDTLAIVGIGSMFPPSADGVARRFPRASLRLPAGKMLLPDVTEHMDTSQYLAGMVAEAVFASMPKLTARLKKSTGIVLGLESKTAQGVAANERIFVDRLRRRFQESGGPADVPATDGERILNGVIDAIRRRNPPSGPYTLPGLMPNVAAGRIASLFDLNGPNIVVDMADHSLLQAVAIAAQLLSHGDCDLVLSGGIGANAGDDPHRAEAAVLMAVTTFEIAQREGLPVLATVTLQAADAPDATARPVPIINPGLDYGAATGGREIIRALERLATDRARYVVAGADNGARSTQLVFASASSATNASPPVPDAASAAPIIPSAYAYVQGTPISCYRPVLTPVAATGDRLPLDKRRIVFITDQPDLWGAIEGSGALNGLHYKVVCPSGASIAHGMAVDLGSDDSARSGLAALDGIACDTLIAIKSLSNRAADTLLEEARQTIPWMDLLFAASRHYYDQIADGRVALVTLCLDAQLDGEPDPYTGLVAGFMKSLARELPGGACRIVNTDTTDVQAALRLTETELAQIPSVATDEVHHVSGVRHLVRLAPVPDYTSDQTPVMDADSVVIATGGGRGVTAVLAERLLTDFGCRVIAIGRSDPSSLPPDIARMDERALKDFEATFYQQQLRRGQGLKITDLKRQYLGYRAAAEVGHVTRQLQQIGRYDYRSVDLTDQGATEAFVDSVFREHGRVDMVLHGAGIQISKMLPKKTLDEFRRIVAAKLSGLSYLQDACERRREGRSTHYHLLTSAFSYVGNDGQCDYGAANEAMNRLAVAMNRASATGHWSSLAWLGWAGIGMTRDPEFAALAASRGLRGVTKAEGQELFSALMKGTPATPANVLLAPGEIDYYKVGIAPATRPAAPTQPALQTLIIERALSLHSDPYLRDHLVDGAATVPGAQVIAMVADAAQQLRPDLTVTSFERAQFLRFIKIYGDKPTQFRLQASIVTETAAETVIRVRLMSDFIHRNGTVLQKDILQHDIDITMATALPPAPAAHDPGPIIGQLLDDPYVMAGSPVRLSGPFRTMSNITVGREFRRADYRLDAMSPHDAGPALPRIMLMDSLWRFGAMDRGRDGSLPIHVPEKCRSMKMYFDFSRVDAARLMGTITFRGANPRDSGDTLQIGPVAAYDAHGRILLSVEGGICRRVGEVRHDMALQITGT